MISNQINRRYFETQEENEKVIIVIRKHWTVLLAPFLIGTILALILLFLFFSIKSGDPFKFGEQPIYEAFFILMLLFDLTYVLTSWLIRYFNAVILTNEHLVEIEQMALFSRKISVLDLTHIEDAAAQQNGFLETLLNYGSLEIQTAAEIRNFIFKGIPDPDSFQNKIMEQKDANRSSGFVAPDRL